MTDRQYLKQMIAINDYMQRLAERDHTDPDDWHDAIDEMHRVNNIWYHSRRRQAWFRNTSIVVLACVLAYGFYIVLQLLKM